MFTSIPAGEDGWIKMVLNFLHEKAQSNIDHVIQKEIKNWRS